MKVQGQVAASAAILQQVFLQGNLGKWSALECVDPDCARAAHIMLPANRSHRHAISTRNDNVARLGRAVSKV